LTTKRSKRRIFLSEKLIENNSFLFNRGLTSGNFAPNGEIEMNRNLKVLFVTVFAVLIMATTSHAETFYAYLSSAQEVPTNASTATGYARVFVNEAAGTFTFTLVFNGLSSNQTASHIHAPAAIGANSGVAIGFGAVGGTSGTISGSGTITPTQLSQLRAHQGYVNVHSANFSGGEIRGQLGIKRPVDFDGDGRQDYSILRFPAVAPQTITYFNFNSTAPAQYINFGDAATDFPTPGDYDGDGKDDLALVRSSTTIGAPKEYFIFRSSNNTLQYYNWGITGDINVARDYDGDGITDVAVFRRGASVGAQSVWYIRQSATNTVKIIYFGTTGDTAGGTTGDTPVPGDYDGDGKFDVAVYRFGGIAPDNTFIVQRSSDSVWTYQQWGNFQTDYVVPGDYDGDGKYDFAVARTGAAASSPMTWWILQSSNGLIKSQPFGISSDIPTQGDYDGDARTDISVYRKGATAAAPSTFWVLNSLNNSVLGTTWGLGSDFAVATFDAR
jgi:hypothetical protein